MLFKKFSSFLHLDDVETKKVLRLSAAFFCVIGSCTIIRDMKDSLFIALAGIESIFLVKAISVLVLVPATLLYVKLVDKLGKYKLLWFYTTLYGSVTMLIAFLLGTDAIGLSSDNAFIGRKILGWLVYFFYEGAAPFVLGLFWSFVSSVSSPDTAKKGYPVMVSVSKLGGMLTTGLAWSLFRFGSTSSWCSDVVGYQISLLAASLLLWFVPYLISKLREDIAEKNLHGYEAAYAVDKKTDVKKVKEKVGLFSGVLMMKKHRYVLGMFGMVFFYKFVNMILCLQRLIILKGSSETLSGFNQTLFQQRFLIHGCGLLVSFFVTRPLVNKFGERICLLFVPVIAGLLLLYLMVFFDKQSIMFVYMTLVIMNFSFEKPVRESLYIPTVRDIRFKTKAWIDSFGVKLSMWSGSLLVGGIQYFVVAGSSMFIAIYSLIFGIVSVSWFMTSWFLGKKYDHLIKNNQVVGSKD